MSTKEWLMRAWKIDNEIAALERELILARERTMSVTGHANDVKVQTSNRNTTEDAIHKCIEYQQKIKERIDYLYSVKQEIFDAISKVENSSHRTLLDLRYLRYMTWERIAEELHLDLRYVYRLHGVALKSVEYIQTNL